MLFKVLKNYVLHQFMTLSQSCENEKKLTFFNILAAIKKRALRNMHLRPSDEHIVPFILKYFGDYNVFLFM